MGEVPKGLDLTTGLKLAAGLTAGAVIAHEFLKHPTKPKQDHRSKIVETDLLGDSGLCPNHPESIIQRWDQSTLDFIIKHPAA